MSLLVKTLLAFGERGFDEQAFSFFPLHSYSLYFIVIDKSLRFFSADYVVQLSQITTLTEKENATLKIPSQTNIWHLFIMKLAIWTIMT